MPTAEMLRGDFTTAASPACNAGGRSRCGAPFVNNQVPVAALDPVALRYLEFIPVSTDPCGRYQYGYPTPSTDHQIVGRVDFQQSARHSIYTRYMDINYKLPNYFDGVNALTTPSVGVDNRGRSLVVGDTFSLSNSVINSFRATAIRFDQRPHAVRVQVPRRDRGPTSTRPRSPARSRTSASAAPSASAAAGTTTPSTTTPCSRSPTTSTWCAGRTRSRSAWTSCTSG